MTDPITVGVISSAVRATALEMSEALRRSAYSPIIREMLDYSCAVFTADGETVAQDELIPAFLGTMATTMPWVLEAAAERPLEPGDVYFTNDPYRGGTHTPDIQLFAPVIDDGKCVAWCGNIAHHSDVGGVNPGTEGFANRSIFEEGLRIPPLPLVACRRGQRAAAGADREQHPRSGLDGRRPAVAAGGGQARACGGWRSWSPATGRRPWSRR